MNYYFLIDCNNFFVSCERLFCPHLENKPVIVLSSNDGCVISRSNEAKALGIKMGEPYFQIKSLCKQHDVAVFSSNFYLYGNISARIMQVLREFCRDVEVYSVDEAFLKISCPSIDELIKTAVYLQNLIKKNVGIPVTIGMAPTKTLAKMACHLGKKKGIYHLLFAKDREVIFEEFLIEEVWGIGRKLTARLKALAVYTVADFIKLDVYQIKKLFGVFGERIYWELKGISALDVKEIENKRSITYSRMFGQNISELDTLLQAVSFYTEEVCYKLRKQQSVAIALQVFLEETFTKDNYKHTYTSDIYEWQKATDNTLDMIKTAKILTTKLYDNKKSYRKCGVMLFGLTDKNKEIPDLFLPKKNEKDEKLLHVIDEVRKKFGKKSLKMGSSGLSEAWKAKAAWKSFDMRSWDHLPIVQAG